MPRVLSYLPDWLSRGSPGFNLFAQPEKRVNQPKSNIKEDEGPTSQRTIAHRGNEVFVASGNELRWASLANLKDSSSGSATNGYKTLKINVALPIREIVMSPNEDYMAICTSHTVHIAVLPDSHHLSAADNGSLRLKTFHLGPTVHVLDHAPLAATVWHPLGYRGRCLVTVTTDANVRLWEFDKNNRVSFSEPELAIDLKKLASGVNSMDDFRASRINDKTGFSADSFELEVASACFGSPGARSGGRGWGPMTLWIAMKGGNIYALCPLLPNRFQYITDRTKPSYFHSLELQIQAKDTEDEDNTPDSSFAQQSEWLELLNFQHDVDQSTGDRIELYTRPSRPGPVPKLQGPFFLDPEIDIDSEIKDILVLEPAAEDEHTDPSEDGEVSEVLAQDDSPPVPVICLVTNDGYLHVCLNFESVEGQWLPKERSFTHELPTRESLQSLLVFETIKIYSGDRRPSALSFTADPTSPLSFFVTHEAGVFHVSLSPWLPALQDELDSLESQERTTELRIEALMKASHSEVQRIIDYSQDAWARALHSPLHATSCICISTPALGSFVLTTSGPTPYAATLETAAPAASPADELSTFNYTPEKFEIPQPWPIYQPPASLFEDVAVKTFLAREAQARHKAILSQEIRLSTATLELLGKAHREIALETQKLGQAASSLFTRCQWLQNELVDQIRKAKDVALIVDEVTGDDEADYAVEGKDVVVGKQKIEERMEGVRRKQRSIVERTERLRGKVASVQNQGALSDRERAWFAEVDKMRAMVLDEDVALAELAEEAKLPARRLAAVRELKEELEAQARRLEDGEGDGMMGSEVRVKVPNAHRQRKIEDVMALLAREEAMVEAAVARLRRLNGGVGA